MNEFVSDEQRRFWVKYCDENRRVMTSTSYPLVKAAFIAGWSQGYKLAAIDYY